MLENPELIEAGFIPEKAEYDFAEGWARADIFGYDSNYNPVMVEVKQNAILNGNGFDNGLKGLQQTTGYKSSQQATVDYYFRKCPLLKETLNTFEKPKARGILAAYEIDENVKEALNENGAEYKIIDKEKIK